MIKLLIVCLHLKNCNKFYSKKTYFSFNKICYTVASKDITVGVGAYCMYLSEKSSVFAKKIRALRRIVQVNPPLSHRLSSKTKKISLAGISSILATSLGVWGWQLASAPNLHSIVPTSTPDLSNLNNNSNAKVSGESSSLNSVNGSMNVSSSLHADGTARVTVNGQNIPVPQQGTVNKNVKDENGNNTNVSVNVQNDSTSVSTHTSPGLRISTHTTTNISNSTDVTNQSVGGN